MTDTCCTLIVVALHIDTGAQNGYDKVEEKMFKEGKTTAEVEAELARRSSNNSNAGTLHQQLVNVCVKR
jgi:hypothetical protein